MTKEQINSLCSEGRFPVRESCGELVETHISWVLLCDRFVYKIKKPVHYSFLDFSTLQRRKHFCEREIELNRRLTKKIYVDVQPVLEVNSRTVIGGRRGTLIDYAVRMHKMDRDTQMDRLLFHHRVTDGDIRNLAKKIASFHKNTKIIYEKNFLDVQDMFNDLGSVKDFLSEYLDNSTRGIIDYAIDTSDKFLNKNRELLRSRLTAGFFRDCHGDLHSRNIFLLPSPQPFDCIEFNDDFRQIDVLNEAAFLCMDLDAFERQDLSALFIEYYNAFFPSMKTVEERDLFIYYKSYRANVRAKVNGLRAKSAATDMEKTRNISAACKYLQLMDSYIKSLNEHL